MKTWNNVNWSYCKHGYLCKKWCLARLNLEKTIFKPKNKTIYFTNVKLWRLKFYVISWSTRTEKTMPLGVSKNWKNSAATQTKEAQVAVNREKGRRFQRVSFNFLSQLCNQAFFGHLCQLTFWSYNI